MGYGVGRWTLLSCALVPGCAASGADRGFRGVAVPETVAEQLGQARLYVDSVELPSGCRRMKGLSTLGTRAHAVAKCHVHASAGPRQLSGGGSSPRKYAVLFDEDGMQTFAHTDAHLGRSLAPVNDWQSALAIVALRYSLLESPSRGQGFEWEPLVEPLPEPSVAAAGEDWIVRWPTYAVFGCHHDLWMATYVVHRDGTTEFDRAKRLRVANSPANICID